MLQSLELLSLVSTTCASSRHVGVGPDLAGLAGRMWKTLEEAKMSWEVTSNTILGHMRRALQMSPLSPTLWHHLTHLVAGCRV